MTPSPGVLVLHTDQEVDQLRPEFGLALLSHVAPPQQQYVQQRITSQVQVRLPSGSEQERRAAVDMQLKYCLTQEEE